MWERLAPLGVRQARVKFITLPKILCGQMKVLTLEIRVPIASSLLMSSMVMCKCLTFRWREMRLAPKGKREAPKTNSE